MNLRELAIDIERTRREADALQKIADGHHVLANLPDTDPNTKSMNTFKAKAYKNTAAECRALLAKLERLAARQPVTVEQRHIDAGACQDSRRCAIALAMMEAHGTEYASVDTGIIPHALHVSFDDMDKRIWRYGDGWVCNWLTRFDSAEGVYPVTLLLHSEATLRDEFGRYMTDAEYEYESSRG